MLDACVLYLLVGQSYFVFSDAAVNVLTKDLGDSSDLLSLLNLGGNGLLGIAGSVIGFFTGSSVDFAELSESLSRGGLSLMQTDQLMQGLHDAGELIRNEDLFFYTEMIHYMLLFLLGVFLLFEAVNFLLGIFGKGVNLFCAIYGTAFFLILAGAAAAVDYAVYTEEIISAIFGQLPMGVSVWAVCCLVFPYIARVLMKSYAKEKGRRSIHKEN